MRPTSSRNPSAQIKRLHFGQPVRGCLLIVGSFESRRGGDQNKLNL
jgi:hypothetical protein